MIFISPRFYHEASGNMAITANDQLHRCGEVVCSPAASGWWVDYKTYIQAGTYCLGIMFTPWENRGIWDVILDGEVLETIDMYTNKSPVAGRRYLKTNIEVANSGVKTLTLRNKGKRAAATNYQISLQEIVLYPDGVTSFSPVDVPGLSGWWSADTITGTGLSHGDPVSAWQDQSASGNDLTQATSAYWWEYRENVINGLPSVMSSGGIRLLDAPVWNTLRRGGTIIAVVKSSNYTVQQNPSIYNGNGSSNGYGITTYQSSWSALLGGVSWGQGDTASNQWRIISLVISRGHTELYRNGIPMMTTAWETQHNIPPTDNFEIRTSAGSSPGTHLAEVLYYNYPIGPEANARVVRYLKEKYAL